MNVELVCCTATLLQEIAEPGLKRNDIALTYRMAMESSERQLVDWPKVNEAIIKRWSLAGLIYIKNRAWKLKRPLREISSEGK
jgi:hypothetical protein